MSSAKLLSRKATTSSLSCTNLFFRNRITTATTLNGAFPIPTHRRISGFHLTPRSSFSTSFTPGASSRVVQELLAEVEKEKQRERDSRKRAGLGTEDIDGEDNEDFMGIAPLIEKLEKEKLKDPPADLNLREEPSDSESDEDDERFSPENLKKGFELFEKKFNRHKELIGNFVESETLDDAFRWMDRIDKFEEKHFRLRPEYRVIGELMNRLKIAEGKEKFILQQKLNRAMTLVQWKEAYDPNNPANFGIIQHEQGGPPDERSENFEEDKDKEIATRGDDDSEEEFDDMKERDDILIAKLNEIDRLLEEKLAELDHTFGRKGKALEEEIRDLAEERNALTESKRKPLYRKGFDVKLIDVNRTCKVTKGGQVAKYTAMLACGNYQGVVGFAKAKGPAVPIALQKAYEKCFRIYTILSDMKSIQSHMLCPLVDVGLSVAGIYKDRMKAGRTVETILNLAGFKNVKSKVIGSRNPHNTVKALFKALNAIETPKDVQEKFGRTVVEKYLL
ncbi:hypothetical protein MLD38_030000 [Melastoma candidum]|uniref:Uncharacterized protein n=1 Tax=Melastoma candidum TaxID=119954 RepID=A0ACB9MKH4_9MYRT|nr:hypothetical protein MLD38_030000 [Melastoma candidum]